MDAVIIKGMKMPECCHDCPMDYDGYMCNFSGKTYHDCDPETQRKSDCPLEETFYVE